MKKNQKSTQATIVSPRKFSFGDPSPSNHHNHAPRPVMIPEANIDKPAEKMITYLVEYGFRP